MAARVRKPPSKQIPCRVMSKSVDNEEHSYVPDTDKFVKFDGVTGCKITQKNKCMGDYKCIYPMLDSDGVTRLVTDSDFHKRIMHKYRSFEGYSYVYPVLTLGLFEGKRSDLIPAPKDSTSFVPEEVNRMIPQGVEQILTHYDDRSILLIASRRGEIYLAGTRKIPSKTVQNNLEDQNLKPNIKSVSELNEEAEPKPSKKQLKDIERWKKQMEELNRYGNNLSGNRIVHFGCEVNREEWRDDDIMSWFAENYPEDNEEDAKGDNTDNVVDNIESKGELISSKESSFDDGDSGYVERRNRSLVSSRTSVESINSDDGRTQCEIPKNVFSSYDNESSCSENVNNFCDNHHDGLSTTGHDPSSINEVVSNLADTGCVISEKTSSKRKLSVDHADSGKLRSTTLHRTRNCTEHNDQGNNCFPSGGDINEGAKYSSNLNLNGLPTENNTQEASQKYAQNPKCQVNISSENHLLSNKDFPENTEQNRQVCDQNSKNLRHNNAYCDYDNFNLRSDINDKETVYQTNSNNCFLSVGSKNPQTRHNSESTDRNSVKSDLFFDADDAFNSDACSDGFLTPERDAFDLEQPVLPDNIAELVRSLSSLQDDLEYHDEPVLDRKLMEELFSRSEMESGIPFKDTMDKIQIPLM